MNKILFKTPKEWGRLYEYMGIKYIKQIDDRILHFVRLSKIPLFEEKEITAIHNNRLDLCTDIEKRAFLQSSYDICSFCVYRSTISFLSHYHYYKFGCLLVLDSEKLMALNDKDLVEFSKALSQRHLKEHLAKDDRDKIIAKHFELFKEYKEF